jgi:hypothetical protein
VTAKIILFLKIQITKYDLPGSYAGKFVNHKKCTSAVCGYWMALTMPVAETIP